MGLEASKVFGENCADVGKHVFGVTNRPKLAALGGPGVFYAKNPVGLTKYAGTLDLRFSGIHPVSTAAMIRLPRMPRHLGSESSTAAVHPTG